MLAQVLDSSGLDAVYWVEGTLGVFISPSRDGMESGAGSSWKAAGLGTAIPEAQWWEGQESELLMEWPSTTMEPAWEAVMPWGPEVRSPSTGDTQAQPSYLTLDLLRARPRPQRPCSNPQQPPA